jgi:integrase
MARKKQVLFKVLHSKFTKNGCDWVITGYPEGKRVRLWFKTEKAAKKEANERNAEITATGTQDQLPYALRITALQGAKDLEPFKKTLADAVDFYVKHLKAIKKSITVRVLVDEYLAVQKSRNKSAVHQKDMRGRLKRFCLSFGNRPVHDITSKEIEQWLFSLKVAPVTFNNYRERVGFLFGYAIKHGYLEKDTNPVNHRIEKIPVVDAPVEIFKVDELAAILSKATPELLPMFAIGAFAGLRTNELLQLKWEDVKLLTGYLDVRADIAKSSRSRYFKIESNLLQWLAPYAGRTGRLWVKSEDMFIAARKSVRKTAGVAWVDNGLRHSYASYFFAKYQNQNVLAYNLGHKDTDLIYSNYRSVIKIPAEGDRYFALLPTAPANVVAMTAAA